MVNALCLPGTRVAPEFRKRSDAALHVTAFLTGRKDITIGTSAKSAYVFQIAELKQFTTSDGRQGQRLEVKLFDDSVSSFSLVWCVMVIH